MSEQSIHILYLDVVTKLDKKFIKDDSYQKHTGNRILFFYKISQSILSF